MLGQQLFVVAQTPEPGSLVLPQDRIIPFLGGGPLLRSSTLDGSAGVVVALGGAPIELVVATDMNLQFLQVSAEPVFLFRVSEKIALRIREPDAIVQLAMNSLETTTSWPSQPGRKRPRGKPDSEIELVAQGPSEGQGTEGHGAMTHARLGSSSWAAASPA